jgi:hypothetical protein
MPNTWDYILMATNGLIALLLLIVGYFISEKFKRYDKHLEAGIESDKVVARLQEQFNAHKEDDAKELTELRVDYNNMRRTLHWLGDCLMTIGVKFEVTLPPRPD